jgi:predicted 2-oxoglutarate/Fe(II)-dependent dioxygenase YbiX/peroxiredoxin
MQQVVEAQKQQPQQQQLVRLTIGEPMPDLGWTDSSGQPFSLYTDSHCGRPTALVVCHAGADAQAVIARFRDLHKEFKALGAEIVVVTSESPNDNARTTLMMGLPMPVVADAAGGAAQVAGLRFGAAAVIVLSPLMRVDLLLDPARDKDPAAAALEHFRLCREEQPAEVVVTHPPVLVLPNVLPPQLCQRIIALFERSERYKGGTTNGTSKYVLTDVKVREDAAAPDDSAEAQAMFALFRRRVFPEIHKVFRYRVTRVETMRIGCYDSANSGRFGPHRDDNVPKMRHRTFGFTINLNAGEYEGGYLTFPEYGPQLYKPDTGSMVVFSASLLHEATQVTEGKRYGIFGFLFGEREEAWRSATNPAFQSTVVDSVEGSYHVGRGSEGLPDPRSVI